MTSPYASHMEKFVNLNHYSLVTEESRLRVNEAQIAGRVI